MSKSIPVIAVRPSGVGGDVWAEVKPWGRPQKYKGRSRQAWRARAGTCLGGGRDAFFWVADKGPWLPRCKERPWNPLGKQKSCLCIHGQWRIQWRQWRIQRQPSHRNRTVKVTRKRPSHSFRDGDIRQEEACRNLATQGTSPTATLSICRATAACVEWAISGPCWLLGPWLGTPCECLEDLTTISNPSTQPPSVSDIFLYVSYGIWPWY